MNMKMGTWVVYSLFLSRSVVRRTEGETWVSFVTLGTGQNTLTNVWRWHLVIILFPSSYPHVFSGKRKLSVYVLGNRRRLWGRARVSCVLRKVFLVVTVTTLNFKHSLSFLQFEFLAAGLCRKELSSGGNFDCSFWVGDTRITINIFWQFIICFHVPWHIENGEE